MYRLIFTLLAALLMMAGCATNTPQQSMFGAQPNSNPANPAYAANPSLFSPSGGAAQQNTQQLAAEMGSLNYKLQQFDSDNQNLNAQVAALQQRLQISNSYNDQLKQQLSDQMVQLQQARTQIQQTPNQTQIANNGFQSGGTNYQNAGYQNAGSNTAGNVPTIPGLSANNASTPFAGATIRANNGLMNKLQAVQLPGFKTWMDGDVIRIEGPTDRLFVSGTYQLNTNDAGTITQLANTIRQQFPRQVVGVEAHWDGTPIEPATTSHHQLTATQSLAVFDLLVRSGLPNAQVFTMAMGSNRLRYPKGNPANRRIEIVIYPETF